MTITLDENISGREVARMLYLDTPNIEIVLVALRKITTNTDCEYNRKSISIWITKGHVYKHC